MRQMIVPVLVCLLTAVQCDSSHSSGQGSGSSHFHLVDSLPRLQLKKTVKEALPSAPARMVIYLDSIGCTCRTDYLVCYNQFVDYSQLLGEDSFSSFVIYSVRLKDKRDIIEALQYSRFEGPMFVDSSGVIPTLNDSLNLEEGGWNVFLIDKKDSIIMSGVPDPDTNPWPYWQMKIDSLIQSNL